MAKVKFTVGKVEFGVDVPDTSEGFDEKYGKGICITCANRELIRNMQSGLRALYKANPDATEDEAYKVINETKPGEKRARVGGISKSNKIKAVAEAVKNGNLDEAKRLFAELGFAG